MAQLDVRRLYATAKNLTQQDLDAIVDDVETFFNLTKLNADNIQDASVTASTKFIDGTISSVKIQNDAVTTVKIIDDAVTTAKIGGGQVTTALINDLAVTAAKIADASITTAKITDAAITAPKIISNYVEGADFSYTTSSAGTTTRSYSGTITGASVTITATGKPVIIGFQSNSTNTGGHVQVTGDYLSSYYSNTPSAAHPGPTGIKIELSILRDGVAIHNLKYQHQPGFSARFTGAMFVNIEHITIPIGIFHTVDVPSAASHTYTVGIGINHHWNDTNIDAIPWTSTVVVAGSMYAIEVP